MLYDSTTWHSWKDKRKDREQIDQWLAKLLSGQKGNSKVVPQGSLGSCCNCSVSWFWWWLYKCVCTCDVESNSESKVIFFNVEKNIKHWKKKIVLGFLWVFLKANFILGYEIRCENGG